MSPTKVTEAILRTGNSPHWVRSTIIKLPVVKVVFLIALHSLFVTAACNPVKDKASLTGLIDTSWILSEIDGQPPIPGTMISMQVMPELFSGSAGCNRYYAEYISKTETSYTIEFIALNAEGCRQPEGILEQEDHYIAVLQSSVTYQLLDRELLLLDAQGKMVLRFTRRQEFDVTPDVLIGKTWRLVSATGLDNDQAGEFTIWFEESSFQGKTVCRDYEGKYQAENDRLVITMIGMTTDNICDEQQGQAEGQFTSLLENAEQYNITLNRLVLYTRRGEMLTFELVINE